MHYAVRPWPWVIVVLASLFAIGAILYGQPMTAAALAAVAIAGAAVVRACWPRLEFR